ncbi:hypothetical protein Ari01nite_70070 [Paractinoplanes rishiriensis]|uniref:LPXTG cell wall anchor domain-containing protein n=1 Tax=Paractinoplanes rishiriensis TaxID=1050105 RepID=A0A919K593_9ACTN|nr:hypothetical protein Ari01nite_70070 [Actinoplanes rishiriensis]
MPGRPDARHGAAPIAVAAAVWFAVLRASYALGSSICVCFSRGTDVELTNVPVWGSEPAEALPLEMTAWNRGPRRRTHPADQPDDPARRPRRQPRLDRVQPGPVRPHRLDRRPDRTGRHGVPARPGLRGADGEHAALHLGGRRELDLGSDTGGAGGGTLPITGPGAALYGVGVVLAGLTLLLIGGRYRRFRAAE